MQQKQYESEQYSRGNLKSSFIRGFSSLKSQRKNGFLVRFRMSGNGCVVQAQDLF